ncbi:MAG: CmcI family methyltransferase [Actinomycetota bacterium]
MESRESAGGHRSSGTGSTPGESPQGGAGDPGSDLKHIPEGDRAARVTRRYLNLLRDALLDEHYPENEVRIAHLLECVSNGEDVDPNKLANPARHMVKALRELKQERQAGALPANAQGAGGGSDVLAYAGLGRVRLDHLESCLEVIRDEAVEGDLVEVGTGRGGAAIFMRGFLEAYELSGPRVWVADRFDGRASDGLGASSRFPPDFNMVRDGFARFGLLDDRVLFLQGAPSRTLAEASIDEVALLRVDLHDPEEVRAVLDALYDRVAPGGFVLVDDYGAADCRAAVEGFRSERGVCEPLKRIDWSGTAWRKTSQDERRRTRISLRGARRAAPETPSPTKELAVVVVVFDMRREAARTLHSLSRSYQRGVDDLDYEVIVVENGSAAEQRLGEEFVRSFGEEFRYIELGDDAAPSPVHAINRGIAASNASTLALMIDGAHLLTPGVLHFATLGLSTYAPAIVTVKHWYVGPGQQPQAVSAGYEKEFEDRLFVEIGWPTDGYRLFEISHSIGDRDWFDGDWESNCIFVPRALLEQVGGMDESFSKPGGGFVNLDFFERMVGSPGVTLVSILGEASFHQVHGGTTTNLPEPDELIRSYDDQYEELRGHRFQVPPQRAHYIGSLPPGARRTKPRRMSRFQHFKQAHIGASDQRPLRPVPVPQDLKTEFIDALWRSGEWHRTTWLGRHTHRPPTDLSAYQELIFRLRPDWIVETRTGAGGRALFCASICDLIEYGQVLSIDSFPFANPPDHPRVTFLGVDPAAERTAAEAREIVGERPRCLVILGAGSDSDVLGAFRNFAPLVPVGSYVVVEDTILQGNPVWSDFGPGPAAAVQEIVGKGEFVSDPSLERCALTFNVRGFLKRVRRSDALQD